MPEILRCAARTYGSELRLQPQRGVLQGPQAGGPGRVHGRRWGRPRGHGGQHHKRLIQADGADEARRRAGARRHQQLPERHRSQETPHTYLPHGGRQPLQGRVPARGDQPKDSGHHLGRQPLLLGARAEVPHRVRDAQGEDFRHRLPDGGGIAQQPEGDRGVGHP